VYAEHGWRLAPDGNVQVPAFNGDRGEA